MLNSEVQAAAMRKAATSMALVLSVFLFGPLLHASPFEPGVSRAADPPLPSQCPEKMGKLPINASATSFDEGSDLSSARVSCGYLKIRKGKKALSLGFSVEYLPVGINLAAMAIYNQAYCWAIHGQDSFAKQDPGNVYPVGDRYISGSSYGSNDALAGQAEAALDGLIAALAPAAEVCPATVTIDAINGVPDPHLGENGTAGSRDAADAPGGNTTAAGASTVDDSTTTVVLTGDAARAVIDAGLGSSISLEDEDRYGVFVRSDGAIGHAEVLGGGGVVKDVISVESDGELVVLVTIDIAQDGLSGAAVGLATEVAEQNSDQVGESPAREQGLEGEPGDAKDETSQDQTTSPAQPAADEGFGARPGAGSEATPDGDDDSTKPDAQPGEVAREPAAEVPQDAPADGPGEDPELSTHADLQAALDKLEASLPQDLRDDIAGEDGSLSPRLQGALGVLDGLVRKMKEEMTPDGQAAIALPEAYVSDLIRRLDAGGEIESVRFESDVIKLKPKLAPFAIDLSATVDPATGQFKLGISELDRNVIKGAAAAVGVEVDLDATIELAERIVNDRFSAHGLELEEVMVVPEGIKVGARGSTEVLDQSSDEVEALPANLEGSGASAGELAGEESAVLRCADQEYAIAHAAECPNG